MSSDTAYPKTAGINRESYNAIAQSWNAARTTFSGREREWLDVFLDGLPVPSQVLDLGCGTGRPFAEYVLARGHHLTGVDQAETLLDFARLRLPQGKWIESRIEDFDFADRYSGVVCWDALFHIERSWHERLLSRMAGSIEPGGRMMLTVGGSDHPAFTDTMFGETFFYDSLTPQKTLSVLKGIGFEMLVSEFMNEPTAGRDKGRYAIVAHKA